MTPLDILLAAAFVIALVWDRGPVDRFVSALFLASVCISQEHPYVRVVLAGIAAIVWLANTAASHRKNTADEPATPPGPRMSAHELMSLYEDIAKADRLRATGNLVDRQRASELMNVAIEQAAGPKGSL